MYIYIYKKEVINFVVLSIDDIIIYKKIKRRFIYVYVKPIKRNQYDTGIINTLYNVFISIWRYVYLQNYSGRGQLINKSHLKFTVQLQLSRTSCMLCGRQYEVDGRYLEQTRTFLILRKLTKNSMVSRQCIYKNIFDNSLLSV